MFFSFKSLLNYFNSQVEVIVTPLFTVVVLKQFALAVFLEDFVMV